MSRNGSDEWRVVRRRHFELDLAFSRGETNRLIYGQSTIRRENVTALFYFNSYKARWNGGIVVATSQAEYSDANARQLDHPEAGFFPPLNFFRIVVRQKLNSCVDRIRKLHRRLCFRLFTWPVVGLRP
jgi:hypothetical protein